MHISYIELRNIKSYENSGQIKFAKGINSISGQNGTGKSTLLEAIGFALFDSRTHTSKNFIREGSRNGEVVVGFVDAQDERVYEVVRSVNGSQGNPYIYDPEVKKKIVVGKDDVYIWIKEHLRVSPAGDLDALFEDAVGVQQGLLTASFQLRPGERKIKFDKLLQVDEYDNVFKWLADSEKYLKELIADERVTYERLKTQLADLPKFQQSIRDFLQQIEDSSNKVRKITAEIGEVKEKKASFDSLKEKISEFETEIKLLQGKVSNLQSQLISAEEELKAAQEAKLLVEASAIDFKEYQDSEKALLLLETKRNKRDELAHLLGEIRTNILLLETNLNNAKAELVKVAEAEIGLKRLDPILLEFRQVSSDLDLAKKDIVQRQINTGRVTEETERLEKLEKELEQVRNDLPSKSS